MKHTIKHPAYKFVDDTAEVAGRIRTQYDAGTFIDNLERLDLDIKVFIDGKEIARADALKFANELYDAHKAKFESTHKKIWVHQGATTCANTYHAKWIRK